MPFRHQPLIARQINSLQALDAQIIVVTNRLDDYAFLNLPMVSDLLRGAGPLGGLYTALEAAKSPLLAVVACDMPFISPQLLDAQRRLLVREDVDVVIPRSGEGLEPLHAVYRRAACLPAVRSALDAGERKMISWFSTVRVREMTLAEVTEFDPSALSFTNVNSPEEFRAAEELAARLDGRSTPGARTDG